MSEDSQPGIVVNGATGELVTGDAAGGYAVLGAPSAGAPVGRGGGGTGSPPGLPTRKPATKPHSRPRVTMRIASIWPAAEIIAVDQSFDMTLITMASAHARHRNVRTVTAGAGDDLGVEPHSADIVVASCIANNMLTRRSFKRTASSAHHHDQ